MSSKRIRKIIDRIKGLLLEPKKEWQQIGREDSDRRTVLRDYILLPAAFFSIISALLRLISAHWLVALEYGAINFVACLTAALATHWITREYLANKSSGFRNNSFRLAVYCCSVYLIFRSISVGLSGSFMGDLMAVGSLLSLYTLYTGLETLFPDLNASHKKSALIICGLLILCIPVIITRLLTILLSVPAINA